MGGVIPDEKLVNYVGTDGVKVEGEIITMKGTYKP